MAGRKHAPSSFTRLDETRLAHSSPAAAVRALENRVDMRHREIQTLIADNQRLAGIHVALKQDLAATQEELRRLSATASEVKAERDAEVRQIYEKSLKVDAEVRAVAAMSAELDRVRTDVQELAAAQKELAAQLQTVESDLGRARAETQFVPAIKADIEAMLHEIQRGRNAIEFEKKTHASNLEHRREMDNNMIIMSSEVEKLRAELANAEKRARASMAADADLCNFDRYNRARAAMAADAELSNFDRYNRSPGYPPDNYDNREMGYGGVRYPPGSYSMSQMQAGVDAHSQDAAGTPLHHSYDQQRMQVPR